jgi:glycosyltransferase involved in cell wall biosynthesis
LTPRSNGYAGDRPGIAGLVSVMIPAYNAAKTLRATLSSVLNQRYRPLEVVIIDDGSRDGTGAIADEFAATESSPSLTVAVHHQRNHGLLFSRKAGLEASRGEFLQFLDADDLLHPEKIAACVREFADRDWDVIVPRTYRFSDISEVSGWLCAPPTRRRWQPWETLLSSVTSNYWHTIGPLFRRSIVLQVGGFPSPVHPVIEELEFHGRVKLETRRIRYLPWILNFYRIGNSDSITGNLNNLYRGRLEGALVAARLLQSKAVADPREWASLFRMSLQTYSQTLTNPAGAALSEDARRSWLSVAGSWHPWLAAACSIPPKETVEFSLRAMFRMRQTLRRRPTLC